MSDSARDRTIALLAARSPDASICPSEVARAIAGDGDWRDTLPDVHAAIDRLHAEGLIRLSWKGQTLAKRAGPYRIRRNDRP